MQEPLSRFKRGLCLLLVFCLVALTMVNVGYGSSYPSSYFNIHKWRGKGVYIKKNPSHFRVEFYHNSGLTARQMGEEYATSILKLFPTYEQLVDSYLTEFVGTDEANFSFLLTRVNDIKNQIPQEYRDEIEGFASCLSGANSDKMGDGRLSLNELYLLNTMGDVIRGTQCSAVSVFGARSKTGHTITGRNFDWMFGKQGQFHQIQAVIIHKNGEHSICSIGYVGYFGVVNAFNKYGVFGTTHDSHSGAEYSSLGKHSYSMDLRYALEHNYNLAGVANYLADSSKEYAFNHLIFLSDPFQSQVLENNFSGTGSNICRALRTSNLALNPGIPWGIDNAVAAVNSFMLLGNYDNYTGAPLNTERWNSIIDLLNAAGEKVSTEEMKEIMSFRAGDEPADGDIYRVGLTGMTIIFEPFKCHLEIAFHPKNGEPSGGLIFETIPVFFSDEYYHN
jgi:hypothetical protein